MTLRIAGTEEEIEDGIYYLHTAAKLWSLFDERRAKDIRWWIEFEWAGHEDLKTKVYDVGGCRRLLDLLDGLDDGLRAELTDHAWRLDAATAARVHERYELLVDSWKEEGGTVYTLANRVSEVHQVQWLVKKAVEMGRELYSY